MMKGAFLHGGGRLSSCLPLRSIFEFMINHQGSTLSKLIVHLVGNKVKEEDLVLSQQESGLDQATIKTIAQYLGKAFKIPEFQAFHHPVSLDLNGVYQSAKSIFTDPSTFEEQSQALAKLLYQSSAQPQIKSGEFLVIYYDHLVYGGMESAALALIKVEKKMPFLFTEEQDKVIELFSYKGISPSKIDKAALILDIDEEDGYQVLSVDNTNKEGSEAKFWQDDFLGLQMRSTNYAQTSGVIGATKNFVYHTLMEEEELPAKEALDLMAKSKEYFEFKDEFKTQEFAQEVFGEGEVANRFQEYVKSRDKEELTLSEGFDISREAVKRKQSVFKSVLKLDKNFHIYIHGNRDLIERGEDADGRKFYKVYYQEEH